MLDKHINDNNKQRKNTIERNGRVVAVQLVNGEIVIGELVEHITNKVTIIDWKDYDMKKEIHRGTIKRFLILLKGGLDDGEEKDTAGILR